MSHCVIRLLFLPFSSSFCFAFWFGLALAGFVECFSIRSTISFQQQNQVAVKETIYIRQLLLNRSLNSIIDSLLKHLFGNILPKNMNVNTFVQCKTIRLLHIQSSLRELENVENNIINNNQQILWCGFVCKLKQNILPLIFSRGTITHHRTIYTHE